MARLLDRLSDNVEGDLYVDSTCIDCATCREMVPSVYVEGSGFSYFATQPETEAERRRALMALIACPTGSIGTVSRADIKALLGAFPELVDDNVHFCGFTSKDSFGAWSYFITRPEGNVLHGRSDADISSASAAPAGIPGASRSRRWSVCSTTTSNGCCQGTACATRRLRQPP